MTRSQAPRVVDFRPGLIDSDDHGLIGFIGLFTALASVGGGYLSALPPVPDPAANALVGRLAPPDQRVLVEEELRAIPELVEEAPAPRPQPAGPSGARDRREGAVGAPTVGKPKVFDLIATMGEAQGRTVHGGEWRLPDIEAQVTEKPDGALTARFRDSAPTEDREVGPGAAVVETGEGPGRVGTRVVDTPEEEVVTDSADAGSIIKVVQANRGSIRYCYERALNAEPGLKGRLELRWSLHQGRAMGVEVLDNDTGSAELGTCVVSKVRTWRFPAEETGDVSLPLIFSVEG